MTARDWDLFVLHFGAWCCIRRTDADNTLDMLLFNAGRLQRRPAFVCPRGWAGDPLSADELDVGGVFRNYDA
jgi:hypothetical protein